MQWRLPFPVMSIDFDNVSGFNKDTFMPGGECNKYIHHFSLLPFKP